MSEEQQAEAAAALAQKRAQKEAERNYRTVRSAALTLAEYQHGQDEDIIEIKKEITEAQSDVQQAKLDMQAKQQRLKELTKCFECQIEKFIPEELQLKQHEEAGCQSCRERKEARKKKKGQG